MSKRFQIQSEDQLRGLDATELDHELSEARARKDVIEKVLKYVAERRVMEQEDPAINWEDIRYEVDPEADQDVIDLNELAVAP